MVKLLIYYLLKLVIKNRGKANERLRNYMDLATRLGLDVQLN